MTAKLKTGFSEFALRLTALGCAAAVWMALAQCGQAASSHSPGVWGAASQEEWESDE